MTHPMQQYHDLLARALRHGVIQHNARTGIDCHVIPGAQLQFDLRDGFPAVTTKKLYFGSVVAELLGFFRGYDSAADFRALGTKIWDANANETKAWLENPNRRGTDDLGRIYGKQWTDWRDMRVARSVSERDRLIVEGYRIVLRDGGQGAWLMQRGINQLENALRTILTNPSDRRILISGWRPDEFDRMALPPCHNTYAFIPFEAQRELHLVMTIRSWDLFLGAGFNVASGALFLEIMGRLSGYTAATLTLQAANAHVYANHRDQVEEQLSRTHFPQPTLWIDPTVQMVEPTRHAYGAFVALEPGHFRLDGYQYHPAIKAPMAA